MTTLADNLLGLVVFRTLHIMLCRLLVTCLPFDVEAVVVKIYSYFYMYTVRAE